MRQLYIIINGGLWICMLLEKKTIDESMVWYTLGLVRQNVSL